jgi:UDP-N-acetylglucosamine 2-epimerase
MKTIDLIVGARPNFMKIAPIIDALKAAQAQSVISGENVAESRMDTGFQAFSMLLSDSRSRLAAACIDGWRRVRS